MKSVKIDFGGESKDFPLGISVLLYGSVASGKTTFSLTLAREFIHNGLPCIWVCLDENPGSVREKMQYFKVDYPQAQERGLLRFVDVYTEQITGRALIDPYVITCSSASNLNELNRALMKALSEVQGQGIVVFDSVSTLLLYNRSGTAEEFLKVHMARINSAGFSGFFILQFGLHEQHTEETLKMMCDSVLEFGFEKDVRKIGILKLPLGTTGEWIASNLFAWQQPAEISSSRQSGQRKYLDSGGYLEEIKDGLKEGIEGLARQNIPQKQRDDAAEDEASLKREASGSDSRGIRDQGEAQDATGAGNRQEYGRQAPGTGRFEASSRQHGGLQPRDELDGAERRDDRTYGPRAAQQRERLTQGHQSRMDSMRGQTSQAFGQDAVPVPTVQHIDKQIIVTELSGLPDRLGEQVRNLLNEQLKLRETISEKDRQTKESQRRLEHLENEESRKAYEVREIEAKNDSLRKAITQKKAALAEVEAQKRLAEEGLKASIRRFEDTRSKADAVIERKKILETKIRDLVEDSGELYIDLSPYIQEVISKREAEMAKSKAAIQSFEGKLESAATEIRRLEAEIEDILKRDEDKRKELEDVKTRKAKAEDEMALVSQARTETESRLKDIADKKRIIEEKLKELTGGMG